MNEHRETSVVEIFVLLATVFALFIYFVFHTTNQKTIFSPGATSTASQVVTEENISDIPEKPNDIYDRYIRKIYESGARDSAQADASGEQIKTELQNKTELPILAAVTLDLTEVNIQKYNLAFEQTWEANKKQGMTKEAQIFVDQTKDEKILIPLADIDREVILRSANMYEDFANKIEALKTPVKYNTKGSVTVRNSREVSFILKKIILEKDPTVYKLWLTKYSQQMFDILSARYVQN